MVRSLNFFCFYLLNFYHQTVPFIIHAPLNARMVFLPFFFFFFLEEFPIISCIPVLGLFRGNVTPSWCRIVRPPNYKCQQENFLYLCRTFIYRHVCLSQGDQNNGAVNQSPDEGGPK